MIFNKKTPKAYAEEVLLLLEVPRTNDKKELSAEQMLASLHGILRSKKELRYEGGMQDHFSLEMAAIGQRIRFYIWCPKHLQAFVEGQIYAQYPTVQIHEQEEDYSKRPLTQEVIYGTELVLIDNETIPIKTFPSFEVDPLAAITATLAKLDQPGEEAWIQIIVRPVTDDWHKKGSKMVKRIEGGGGLLGGGAGTYMGQVFSALSTPPEATDKAAKAELSERDKSRISAIQEKGTLLGYQVKIRIIYAGEDKHVAKLRMQAIHGAFKQFNTTNLNGFVGKGGSFGIDALAEYQTRFFIDNGYILNIEELASLFHLPHTSVETPNIVWATTKTAEPPSNIPVLKDGSDNDISLYGVTNFRGTNTVFGAWRSDRGRHIYIIGQTGVGKSGLLGLLTISDIYYDQGLCVVDPHGDYAQDMIKFIPERRIKDVVYFNPADMEWPIGFNPLEVTDPSMKTHISSELVGVLKRMFDSWGPRLEYILRYTLLALLDYPNSTMLDITRMLTEKPFRDDVIRHITDPVVKTFWTTEYASWNDKFASEAVAPVLNKVGAFVANPMIRNIVGQSKSTFNIREIMDNGKILIVNLSRGLVGEDNAAILGALMVTKIQLSAMSRANVDIADRRQFYLYVDEFQNFATDSFAVILSEARKYGLCLTVANQYVSQMEPTVRDAVFGNVGSMVTFRVGADDSSFLSKYYAPQFEAEDIMSLHNQNFVATMTIKGEKSPPFSGRTLRLPEASSDHTQAIIEHTRRTYTQQRSVVEAKIEENMSDSPAYKTATGQNRPDFDKHKGQPRLEAKPKTTSGSKNTDKKKSSRPKTEDNAQKSKTDSPKANSKVIEAVIGSIEPNHNPFKGIIKAAKSTRAEKPTSASPDKPETQAAKPVDSADKPAKKKRTRSRRKKKPASSDNTKSEQKAPEIIKPQSMAENEETVIKLR